MRELNIACLFTIDYGYTMKIVTRIVIRGNWNIFGIFFQLWHLLRNIDRACLSGERKKSCPILVIGKEIHNSIYENIISHITLGSHKYSNLINGFYIPVKMHKKQTKTEFPKHANYFQLRCIKQTKTKKTTKNGIEYATTYLFINFKIFFFLLESHKHCLLFI